MSRVYISVDVKLGGRDQYVLLVSHEVATNTEHAISDQQAKLYSVRTQNQPSRDVGFETPGRPS